jgi:predicted O-linked N-acetylglucosamine transferase (SPINDLY family)
MDFYLTGHLTDQKESAGQYTETLLWLDGPAHCFSYGPAAYGNGIAVSRAELGIPEGVTVYASGANVFKIIPELMILWARLLSSQKDAVLMLCPYGPNWSSSYPKELFAQRLTACLNKQGVPARRLFILDPEPVPDRHQIREYLSLADIYLDSFPFSATTSLIEPMEVGLPIVSRAGTSFRSSMGAALLGSLGVAELIAANDREYLQLARRLGEDIPLRELLSDKIRRGMEARPAFLDSFQYSQQVGRLFRAACNGVEAHD